MLVDLHIHTTFSDGTTPPLDIVKNAVKANLECISITDHDNIDAFKILQENKLLNHNTLKIIPGVELSIDNPLKYEVHILGYDIDFNNNTLQETLILIAQKRLERMQKIVKNLNDIGIKIDYEQVLFLAPDSQAFGRPHIARAMLNEGYTQKIIYELLSTKSKVYVPKYKLSLEDALNLITRANGKPVLAHPGLIGSDKIVKEIIQNKKIHWLEVFHPAHNENSVDKYLNLAKTFNMKITGGSDYHGIGRYPEKLGMYVIESSDINNFIDL